MYSNQVYKARKNVPKGQVDKQNVAVKDEETGRIIEDLDDVLDHILEFNVNNMNKVPPSEEVKELMEEKASVIQEMLDDVNVDTFPKEIPWAVYIKVLEKVIKQKKSCFRDIIKSGRNFKFALFMFINRMYRNEEFPEDSLVTFLTKIWKKKGSQALLKNNRFIHSKEPITKLLEKCVVMLVADMIDRATPQLQAGSRKGRSTRD